MANVPTSPPLKIFFHCPRKISRPLAGRHSRRGESAGLERSQRAELCLCPEEADLLWPRNVPERTCDRHLEDMQLFLSCFPNTRVLNHPRDMVLADSKDRAFAKWRDAGLPIPGFACPESFQDLLRFTDAYPATLLRLNNGASATDTLVLENPSRAEAEHAYRKVNTTARSLCRRGRADSRPIVVELLRSTAGPGLVAGYRAFVVGRRLVGGYALVADQAKVNLGTSVCTNEREEGAFLEVNSRLDALLLDPAFQDLVFGATAALHLDLCCFDFVLVDDSPVLLEANALWGPAAGWAGGRMGKALFGQHNNIWLKRARGYCAWMDRAVFYEHIFDHFDQFRPGL
ncbi:MAG: hypothetical protein K8R59_08350 [Thermoanaerobaculales bacterium]|nr:hypothetical protein [Thermoanaerobaculales bacterium]